MHSFIGSTNNIRHIKGVYKNGNILVNQKNVKCSYIIKEKDIIDINEQDEKTLDALPEKMDLDIVYEDDDIIIVNKQNGIVVHPAVGNPNNTLVNGLLYHSKNLFNL